MLNLCQKAFEEKGPAPTPIEELEAMDPVQREEVELTYKKFRTRKLGSKYNLIESFLEHQY
jgi:hypothetical protein